MHCLCFTPSCETVPPCGESVSPLGETVVFVTLNFRKDLDLFDFAIVVTFANLEIFVFFPYYLFVSILFLYSVFNEQVFIITSVMMVGLGGLEPPTSRLSGARSNHLSYRPLLLRQSKWSFPPGWSFLHFGGDDGIRTHDPLLAGQVLSQLSYTPGFLCRSVLCGVTENWTTILIVTIGRAPCRHF